MSLRLLRGGTVTPSTEIGKGGEGVVSAYHESPDRCFKQYSNGKGEEHRSKLQAMIGSPPKDQSLPDYRSLAWPEDIVIDGANQCVGFVMPLMDKGEAYYSVKHPVERLKTFPSWTWGHLVTVGTNVTTVVNSLHQGGYVIGDLNPSNIHVTNHGRVALVDLDSIQVTTPNEIFRCPVGQLDYTAAEVRQAMGPSGSFQDIARSQATDAFTMTLLLYELLMLGRHPFQGKHAVSGHQESTIPHHIAAELSPLLRSPGITLGTKDPDPWKILPPQTIDVMVRGISKDPSVRPSASEFTKAFEWLSKTVAQCRDEPRHQFSSFRKTCPWCEYANDVGIDPWLPQSERTRLGVWDASPAAVAALSDAKTKVDQAVNFVSTGFFAKVSEYLDGGKGTQLWGQARLSVAELIRLVSSGEISAVEALGWLGQTSNRLTLTPLGLTLEQLIDVSASGAQQAEFLAELDLSRQEKRRYLLGQIQIDGPAVTYLERELVSGLDPSDDPLVERLQSSSNPDVRLAAWTIPGDALARLVNDLYRPRFSVSDASEFLEQHLRLSQWIWDAENIADVLLPVRSWNEVLDASEGSVMAAKRTLYLLHRWERFRRISIYSLIAESIIFLVPLLFYAMFLDNHPGHYQLLMRSDVFVLRLSFVPFVLSLCARTICGMRVRLLYSS